MSTVVVQGLGFVGAVMSLVVANSSKKYQVIGVDLPIHQDLIDKLNAGKFPIESSDPKVKEYFEQVINRGNFRATSDISAYKDADIVIVDINLDVQKGIVDDNLGNDFSVNLDGFKKAIRTIADNCKEDVLVLIETTVPPGTCEKIVKPVFEEVFEKRGLLKKYKIGHSYERVMPGPGYVDSIQNFYRVYSGVDDQSADAVEAFLKTIITTEQYPLTRLGNTTATEMAKVLENSFRAMNIAFIQEWTEFAERAGVNLFEVIDAIRMRPTHKNIMRPGLGVGGYCLTKDPLLASWASQSLFGGNKLHQSEKSVKINDAMPLHFYKMIEKYFLDELPGKRFLILGVSYLQDVGDTRFTPVEPVYKRLVLNRVQVTIHDPYVSNWKELSIHTESEEVILGKEYDAVVIGTPHCTYLNGGLLDRILSKEKSLVVFDPHGCISVDTKNKFFNHSFKITGRGDV
jgi:nucleotide sugar dehydrogenase